MLYYFPYFIGRNAKEVIKSLELESNDLMEWFSNNKMKAKKKKNKINKKNKKSEQIMTFLTAVSAKNC